MGLIDLVREIQAGRQVRWAQGQLYVKLRPLLLSRIDALISPRLRYRLESHDVFQGTFLRALDHLSIFRGSTDAEFLGWFYRIARNHVLDVTRRRSFLATHFTRSDSGNGLRESRVIDRKTASRTRTEAQESLEKVLRRLRPADAHIIRLKLKGLTFKQIAALLVKTEAAVQKAYSRAMLELGATAPTRSL